MTRALAPLLALPLLLAASAAHAQVFVNGTGEAHSCYMSTKTGDMGSVGAIRTCTEALSEAMTRSDEAATYVNRGVLLMRKGDQAAAVADYKRAIAIREDIPEAYINYAAALYYTDRFDDALDAVNTALSLGTQKEAEALFNRALIYDRQGNLKGAYRDLTRVLELKPDWELAQSARARYQVRKASPAP